MEQQVFLARMNKFKGCAALELAFNKKFKVRRESLPGRTEHNFREVLEDINNNFFINDYNWEIHEMKWVREEDRLI